MRRRDLLVLTGLLERGADLSEPRHVTYRLFFGGEDDAHQAAAAITELQGGSDEWQRVRVTPAETSGMWVVRIDVIAVLDPDNVVGADSSFSGVAEVFEGAYEGWEASVEAHISLSEVDLP